MTVKVTIEYQQVNPEDGIKKNLASCTFEIERCPDQGEPAYHDVLKYEVTRTGYISTREPQAPIRATFDHNYYDDMHTLVAEAIDALGRGGWELRR